MEMGVICTNCKKDFDIEVAVLIDVILTCAKEDIVFDGVLCPHCFEEASEQDRNPDSAFISVCGNNHQVLPRNRS